MGVKKSWKNPEQWKKHGGWVHFCQYWKNSAYLPWIFPDHPCMINENEGIWLLYQPWITDICFLYVQFEGKCIVSTCVWKDQKRKVTTKVFKHIFWSYCFYWNEIWKKIVGNHAFFWKYRALYNQSKYYGCRWKILNFFFTTAVKYAKVTREVSIIFHNI